MVLHFIGHCHSFIVPDIQSLIMKKILSILALLFFSFLVDCMPNRPPGSGIREILKSTYRTNYKTSVRSAILFFLFFGRWMHIMC
jgi:hypothetical protein